MVHLYESLRTNNIYNTDLAASCYGPWGQGSAPKTPEERKVRATMNAALHATKTAITHLAVYRHLSKLSKKHLEDVKAYELAKADFIRAIEDKQASKTRKAEKDGSRRRCSRPSSSPR